MSLKKRVDKLLNPHTQRNSTLECYRELTRNGIATASEVYYCEHEQYPNTLEVWSDSWIDSVDENNEINRKHTVERERIHKKYRVPYVKPDFDQWIDN